MPEQSMMGLKMELDQKYIDNLVKQMVEASIIQTLDGKHQIASSLVHEVLNQKVDSEGRPTSSSYYKDTLLSYLTKKMIREEVQNMFLAVLEEKREDIKKVIKKELSKEPMLGKFVECFVSDVMNNLSSSWRTTVNVKFDKINED